MSYIFTTPLLKLVTTLLLKILKSVDYSYPAEIKYFLTIKSWERVRFLRSYVDVDSIAV